MDTIGWIRLFGCQTAIFWGSTTELINGDPEISYGYKMGFTHEGYDPPLL